MGVRVKAAESPRAAPVDMQVKEHRQHDLMHIERPPHGCATDAGLYWVGSGVDNQALFDFDGKALASLPTFKYIHTGAVTDHVFTKIDPVEITATDSDSIDVIKAQLPSEAAAHYQDGVDETETVTWQSAALDWIRGAGTYTITGNLPADAWGNVDKVSLVKKTETPVKPSTENLDKPVAESGEINRDEYTNESLAKLDQALAADQFMLDYDFSAPADAAKVTVTLKSNPNVTETYTVAVASRAEGGSGSGSDGAGNGGATINPDTGEGDKTNGANGDEITGVLSNTGSAVTAVGLAVVVLGVAGGVSLALRRKCS